MVTGIEIARGRLARRAYGFDEIALVPAAFSVDPDEVDVRLRLGELQLDIPVLASAMDAVVDVRSAIALSQLGGLAVLNLEGLQVRYENAEEAIERLTSAPASEAVRVIQEVYQAPIKVELIRERVRQVKREGARLGVACTPAQGIRLLLPALEEGADAVIIQSTVTTARFVSAQKKPLPWAELRRQIQAPLIVGNCVSYEGALELMWLGADAVLVGVGPGAACTTRKVLGVGVPQVTAIGDVAAARDRFYEETGKYVAVVADGGMRSGGDISKAIASGADGVMLGSLLSSGLEAPGKGYHWGMATSHPALPRGTRIKVGQTAPLRTILFGPALREDGTLNLIGALKNAMGLCGARDIKEMQRAGIVIAPAVQTEGKSLQMQQGVG